MDIEVYVISGNHDIDSGWASQFIDNGTQHVRQVLYKDSLSYQVNIVKDFSLLMLDSNKHRRVLSVIHHNTLPSFTSLSRNYTLTTRKVLGRC